jgi:hypothetical protein
MQRSLLFLIASSMTVMPAGVAPAIDLQPHRAVYRMVLSTASRGSDVVSANGVMVYRFARGCDGWTVENRTFLRLFYDNNTGSDTLWSFASWEALDGNRFRFHSRYDQDGKTTEKLDGEADLGGNGHGGSARFSLPPDKNIPLPPGALFPTAHMREVLAAARTGSRNLNRVVFDGGSLDNPYAVNAWFGQLPESDADALAKRFDLPRRPVWWTQMAFFPAGNVGGEPEFEMSAHYREDGIADAILQHFDTFTLDVRLREIQLLPPPDC